MKDLLSSHHDCIGGDLRSIYLSTLVGNHVCELDIEAHKSILSGYREYVTMVYALYRTRNTDISCKPLAISTPSKPQVSPHGSL
jgi:hypothetical protein